MNNIILFSLFNCIFQIFINVCSHANVPYNPDEAQVDKEVFKVVGDKKIIPDNEGLPSTTYDVVVHPNEIRFSDVDSRTKNRVSMLCNMSFSCGALLWGSLDYFDCVFVFSVVSSVHSTDSNTVWHWH